jgi:hypothetical protein
MSDQWYDKSLGYVYSVCCCVSKEGL